MKFHRILTNRLFDILILILLLLFSRNLNCQFRAVEISPDHKINNVVAQINKYRFNGKSPTLKSLLLELDEEEYFIKADSILVSTELYMNDQFNDLELMNMSGAKIVQVLPNNPYYQGYVQLDSLLRFPKLFSDTQVYLEFVQRDRTADNEGPANTNSQSYETGSSSNPNSGNGLTIAIIDGSGWEAYNIAASQGFAPSTFTYFDCSSGVCTETTLPGSNSGDVTGTMDHGTMVAQIVFDHAPASNYILYRSGNVNGRAAAISHAVGQGSDIISCSQSGYNTGWNDNTGVLCAAVNDPDNTNVLMFFSSGNRGSDGSLGSHWQGRFVDNDNDGFHEWSNNDEMNSRISPVGPGGNTNVRLQWNGSVDSYDAQIINEDTNAVLVECNSSGASETCSWTNPNPLGSVPINVGIRIIANSIIRPSFEFWSHNGGFYEYFSNSNQTSSPGNCTNNENLLAVAALTQGNYNLLTPFIDWYSSQGPTNNLNPSVDLTGPTDNTIVDYNVDGTVNATRTTFGGTSCATPNVAGATAAFWSKHPGLSANEVRVIILSQSSSFKDWGSFGYDNAFGHGGMYLFDYSFSNIYISDKNAIRGVYPSNNIYPWDNTKDTDDAGPFNSKAIILDGNIIEGTHLLDKKMLYSGIRPIGMDPPLIFSSREDGNGKVVEDN